MRYGTKLMLYWRFGDKFWSLKSTLDEQDQRGISRVQIQYCVVWSKQEVRLVTQTIPKRESFMYLVSIILESVDINDDGAHRAGQQEWNEVLYDKKVTPKLKR